MLIKLLRAFFRKSFWIFPKPKRNFVIDRAGTEELFVSGVIDRGETLIVDLDNLEWLNIFVIGYGLFTKPTLLIKDKFCFIFSTYIKLVKPKNVLTWMDYIVSFYRLKNYYKDAMYISIQTGRRSIEPGQFFDQLEKLNDKTLKCDYIFCYGSAHAKEYESHINCKAFPEGSIRNNLVNISKSKKRKEILFISQFRKDKGETFVKYYENKGISHEVFYRPEKLLFEMLGPYCEKNKIKLNIVSAMKSAQEEEKIFYNTLLGDVEYNFISHESFKSGYHALDNFEYNICINSTLGYEAIGRTAKVIFFDARNSFLGIPFDLFGWPFVLPEKGDFWTNEVNTSEFERLMNFLLHGSDDDWDEVLKKMSPILMNYNYKSPRLAEVLK